ncbi:MAG: radical SAM protein [Anaerolineae bacterium]|nr:radical SAM protein [Anaerolineae bacterium]
MVNPKSKLPIETRTSPSMALAYLGAISLRRGDEVRVWDGDVERIPLPQVVADFRPHVVGITANTTQIQSAWAAARQIKEVAQVPIVLGGPHPTVLPEESAGRPEVDVVVRSEGEATWEELTGVLDQVGLAEQDYEAVQAQAVEAFRSVLGITFRDADGAVHSTPDRPTIADLDGLPWPAWHLFKLDRYTNLQPTLDHVEGYSLPILTSRGCPYRCTYCSQIMERRWRMRSAESVVAEWRWLVREVGAAEIGVLDDSFNIRRDRVLRICDLLIQEGLNHVPWIMINGIRANLADEELLGRMRQAGCIRTAFGVESGNQEILDSIIHKQLTLDQVRAAFRAAKKVGMETIGFFIIGMPGETEETMEDTIRFAIELDPLVANFSMATPFPGTELYEIVKREGRILAEDWDDFLFYEGKARFEMPGLPAELVERKWREAYRRFYMRPKRILRTLTRKQTWLDLPRTLRVAWRTAVTGGE